MEYISVWLMMNRYLYAVLRLIKNATLYPRSTFVSVNKDLASDFKALSNRVRYPTNFIFIAGLPKSGTTLLEYILANVPGFVQLNKSYLRVYGCHDGMRHAHDVNEAMFKSISCSKYSFLKLHVHHSADTITILNKYNIRSTVLIRDIRDMMLSRYYHVRNDVQHWQHASVIALPFNEGFEKSLLMPAPGEEISPLQYYSAWILDWVRYCKNNPNLAYLMCYEDLMSNTIPILKDWFHFYGMQFSTDELQKFFMAADRGTRRFSSLKAGLGVRGEVASTFRKGKVGAWRSELTKEHHSIFEKYCSELNLHA